MKLIIYTIYIYIPSYIHTQGTASPKMLEGRGGFGGGRPACTVRFRAALSHGNPKSAVGFGN